MPADVQLALRRFGGGGEPDPALAERALRSVEEHAIKLARLVEQLLDISRLEGGRLALDRRETDLAALVEACVAEAQARTDRHRLSQQGPPTLLANIDSLRLEQVLTNLLDNAMKYSLGGDIDVTLAEPRDGGVELAVRDHGAGIPPDRRERIFERFYRAHEHDHSSGMGLGLYISRQIVELHGGELRAEFPPDGGSRFTITL